MKRKETSPSGSRKQVGFSGDATQDSSGGLQLSAAGSRSCQKLLLSSRSVSRDGAPAPSEKSEGYFSSISTSTGPKSSASQASAADDKLISCYSAVAAGGISHEAKQRPKVPQPSQHDVISYCSSDRGPAGQPLKKSSCTHHPLRNVEVVRHGVARQMPAHDTRPRPVITNGSEALRHHQHKTRHKGGMAQQRPPRQPQTSANSPGRMKTAYHLFIILYFSVYAYHDHHCVS